MNNKIIFYEKHGKIANVEELTNENLSHICGMMTRCTLIDGSEKIGYANPFRTHDNKVHDYIFLWIWDNLNEESHKLLIGNEENKYNQTFKRINIDDIIRVESILYSNPRWGGVLTNRFFIK